MMLPLPGSDLPTPATLDELEVALTLSAPSGPLVAGWRDQYLQAGDDHLRLVEACVEDLHARQLCYSCGMNANRLVNDEFPWVCGRCAVSA